MATPSLFLAIQSTGSIISAPQQGESHMLRDGPSSSLSYSQGLWRPRQPLFIYVTKNSPKAGVFSPCFITPAPVTRAFCSFYRSKEGKFHKPLIISRRFFLPAASIFNNVCNLYFALIKEQKGGERWWRWRLYSQKLGSHRFLLKFFLLFSLQRGHINAAK